MPVQRNVLLKNHFIILSTEKQKRKFVNLRKTPIFPQEKKMV